MIVDRLSESILIVMAERSLTYREITARLNAERRYIPWDGLYLAEAQIRDHVRRHPEYFAIDRESKPSRVCRFLPQKRE